MAVETPVLVPGMAFGVSWGTVGTLSLPVSRSQRASPHTHFQGCAECLMLFLWSEALAQGRQPPCFLS